MGYTGGQKLNPTYRSLGKHSEALQIDYDPNVISYQDLLDIFWTSHNPTRAAWSTQYKSAIFAADQPQKALAEASKDRLRAEKAGKFFKRTIHTEVLPLETFYLAEDYHHKYLLQRDAKLWAEVLLMYAQVKDWLNATTVSRLNGYVGGYGTLAQLETEMAQLGLSESGQDYLWRTVRRFNK